MNLLVKAWLARLFDVGRRGSLMNRLERIQQSFVKPSAPSFEIGDTVRVHVKVVEGEKERIQVFDQNPYLFQIKRYGSVGCMGRYCQNTTSS